MNDRRCEWAPCRASLHGYRKDARYCGPACKADANRWRPRSEAFWRAAFAIRRKPRPSPA